MSETDLLTKAFYWAVDNPVLANAIFFGWLGGTLITVVLRAVFPQYETRPSWARALVEVADIFAGNLWRVLGWLLSKLGLQIHTPFDQSQQAQKP